MIQLESSGDMLQQFLITIFDKLDKGSSWDDDFELNTLLQVITLQIYFMIGIYVHHYSYINPSLQESIRYSADKMLLTAPDSLVVSLAKHDTRHDEESALTSRKGRAQGFGIDALDVLNFTYKVFPK
jgi:gamma-tubulin complex component 5